MISIMICFLVVCFLGCSKSQEFNDKIEETKLYSRGDIKNSEEIKIDEENGEIEKDSNEKRKIEINVKDKNDTVGSGNSSDRDKPEARLINYFSPEDIRMNGKEILNMSFIQLIENYGQPIEEKCFKVQLPATEDLDYLNVCVYEGFQCEFFPNDEEEVIDESDTVFRFDITSDSVKLDCGLKVGMSVEEVQALFGDRTIYSLDSENEEYEVMNIKAVLENYKPNDYYRGYEEAIIIYHDIDTFEEPIAKALVLLIEEDRIVRIVFGYPTAG